jgi:hypothetical protein
MALITGERMQWDSGTGWDIPAKGDIRDIRDVRNIRNVHGICDMTYMTYTVYMT